MKWCKDITVPERGGRLIHRVIQLHQVFRSLPDADFRRRFAWIARPRPKATRPELEHLVSLYHLGRQEVGGAALCCDVETREHCACDGWNRFDNPTLEKFCLELTGRPVRIG